MFHPLQFITTVFSHIIDVENFSLLYDVILTPDERAEVTFRLGMLNIFDPLNPDREFILDLRRWDEREMAKILIQLSINEPGNNWKNDGEYRWSKYDDPVPGWILPSPWAQPDEFDNPLLKTHDAGE